MRGVKDSIQQTRIIFDTLLYVQVSARPIYPMSNYLRVCACVVRTCV